MAPPRAVGARARGPAADALLEMLEGFALAAARNAGPLAFGTTTPTAVTVPSERSTERLRDALRVAAVNEAESTVLNKAQSGPSLTMVDVRRRAVFYADNQVAVLVAEITAETRANMRGVIGDALARIQHRGGVSYPVPVSGATVPTGSLTRQQIVRNLATHLRSEVGLTASQRAVVSRYHQSLLDELHGLARADPRRLERAGRQLVRSRSEVERLAVDYGKNWRRHRAETIAATETHAALMNGRQAAWQSLYDQGRIAPGAQRVWRIVESERTCERCAALDGVTVGLTGPWHDEKADVYAELPPLHPRCRCWVDLVEWRPAEAPPVAAGPREFSSAEDAQRWGTDNYSGWANSLPEHELRAVDRYARDDYYDMNRALRGQEGSGRYTPDELRAMNADATSALHRTALAEPITATRVADLRRYNPEVGSIVRDEAFVSTTLSPTATGTFRGDYIFNMNLPAGTRGAYVSDITRKLDEAEFLLPPGAHFKVTSVVEGTKEQGYKTFINMDLVGQDSHADVRARLAKRRGTPGARRIDEDKFTWRDGDFTVERPAVA